MKKSVLGTWKIPRDGWPRYLYDTWQPLAILVLTACFTGTFYASYNPNASRNPNDLFFCNADGNVEVTESYYSPLWDPRLYFTINIAFGQLAFSTAKIIDAGWDTVVGRGGQMVAAMVAYRTIRRSLTLTMETCSVTIPAVASLYSQQIQLIPVGQLVHNMFWHWGSVLTTRKQPVNSGRIRLGLQVFACVYVLSFSTLVSVMTGYRAQLTGYFGYDIERASQLQPISELSRPGVLLQDGDRIGLSNLPIYASEEAIFPVTGLGSRYGIKAFLESSRDLEEPYGVLVDYYYTCMGLVEWSSAAQFTESDSYRLKCSWHECSCSVSRDDVQARRPGRYTIFNNMKSNITVGGKQRSLSAPPLTLGLTSSYLSTSIPDITPETTFINATDFWSTVEATFPWTTPFFAFINSSSISSNIYINNLNDTTTDKDTVTRTGRCVAQDAYSWGFSSLLLLTFCSCTIFFALTLILLQTDVYWNSRHDRDHQHHTIYTDVLYLAEELKNTFGHNVEDHLQNPKDFGKRVERRKEGLRIDVDGLPLSRWQEWKLLLSLAGTDGPENADEASHELRMLRAHDRAIAASTAEYERLPSVGGDELRLEAGQDSERSSKTGT